MVTVEGSKIVYIWTEQVEFNDQWAGLTTREETHRQKMTVGGARSLAASLLEAAAKAEITEAAERVDHITKLEQEINAKQTELDRLRAGQSRH